MHEFPNYRLELYLWLSADGLTGFFCSSLLLLLTIVSDVGCKDSTHLLPLTSVLTLILAEQRETACYCYCLRPSEDFFSPFFLFLSFLFGIPRTPVTDGGYILLLWIICFAAKDSEQLHLLSPQSVSAVVGIPIYISGSILATLATASILHFIMTTRRGSTAGVRWGSWWPEVRSLIWNKTIRVCDSEFQHTGLKHYMQIWGCVVNYHMWPCHWMLLAHMCQAALVPLFDA